MSKYLITGGEGFIGGRITQEIDGVSYDLKSGLDILNGELLGKMAQNTDGIFHCAAKISVPESIAIPDEYYKNNVEGTRSVVQVAEMSKVKIVFSSSAAVYGEANIAVSEESNLNPKSPYARNKIDGENLLRKSSIPHIALRYFNVYGPGQSKEYVGVITTFIINSLRGDDLIIYGDGNQIRDFVFVSDVARANILAMEYNNDSFQVFNIGSGTEISIKILAEIIIQLTSSNSKIVYKPFLSGDIIYSRADVSKAKEVLGWKAEVLLEEGLKETISYYKNKLGK
ncbi:MAG TPA: NAD-dependent epimerase/dehydratase family protein [Candidatus Paceibacterota bacterium]|jgi:UDP-glucose 4-epimerase|nr:NAD-dependent epimerase/dehydratase family protein [Candidatus Paceibacterota bacterium]